jgi:hypothetical protein
VRIRGVAQTIHAIRREDVEITVGEVQKTTILQEKVKEMMVERDRTARLL